MNYTPFNTTSGGFVDLTGQRFGRWLVAAPLGRYEGSSYWLCLCDCGREKPVTATNLRNGKSTSCGCGRRLLCQKLDKRIAIYPKVKAKQHRIKRPRKLVTTHGMSHEKVYRAWQKAKDRCFNPKNPFYSDYGGRGIIMDGVWAGSFEAFYAYMGEPPSPTHSLDRIDFNGNYEPGNCRWATPKEQSNNTRVCAKFEYQGQAYSITDLAEMSGIKRDTLRHRLQAGWSVERAVTEKVKT